MDPDEIFGAIFGVIAVALVITFLVAVFSSHKIESYYVTGEGGTPCVAASVQWEPDPTVYCDKDPQKVLDFLKQANALIGK